MASNPWSAAFSSGFGPLAYTPAATGMTVIAGQSNSFIDPAGNTWTLTNVVPATGQVAINGKADTTTTGTVSMTYVNGEIWALGSNGKWRGKITATGVWVPSAGSISGPF